MKTIAIKSELLAVLRSFTSEQFTVDQLTTVYLDSKACNHSNKKAARQFVYRNMLRMMKADLMTRKIKTGGWPTYTLNNKFNENPEYQETNRSKNAEKLDPPPKTNESPVTAKALIDLSQRLSQHRSDMLCAVGEAEEYDALCSKHPGLKSQTQDLYNHARERSAILLGKIKALETLISIQAPKQC